MIFDTNLKQQYEKIVTLCCSLFNLDREHFLSEVKRHQKDDYNQEIVAANDWVIKWYNSLTAGKPDYSVYDSDYYLYASWLSWKMFSRKYVMFLKDNFETLLNIKISDVKNVRDFGCGIGYSTVAMSEIFTNAKIVGTNVKDSMQFKICEQLAKEAKNVSFITENELETLNCDVAMASEYFEHFEAPIDHLNELYEKSKPRVFVIANAFGPLAVGHFNNYKVNGQILSAKDTSKLFNQTLKSFGYEKIDHKGWNGRPNIWKLKVKGTKIKR